MAGYFPLIRTLLDSSIMDEEVHVRFLFIAMLLRADKGGMVEGTPRALARTAALSVDQVAEALEVLQNPDDRSSTNDELAGARIFRIDETGPNTWYIANYTKYIGWMKADEKRAQHAEAQARYRQSKKVIEGDHSNITDDHGDKPCSNSDENTSVSGSVSVSVSGSVSGSKKNGKGSAEGKGKKKETRAKEEYPPDFMLFWKAYPKKKDKKTALKAWDETEADRPEMDILISKVRELSESDEWQRENGQFVKHPATWLRAGGWDDEVILDPKKDPDYGNW